ncbi:hypothetical protein HELRODRAFT_191207 [Helobdella robusta]|uniref:phospholipase A2 n=1 Tax=Helobdella robusta TaxID=6412 RepID=T1FSQ8_HELRO|nr:hypothetical protein HELRODRAFT_191207 [Helobdella robusta]ESO06816.1 hypothetical protein HELRODRAFT_191207 [Helobdella robusta]
MEGIEMFSKKKSEKDAKNEFKVKLTPLKEISGLKALASAERLSMYKVSKLFQIFLTSPEIEENKFYFKSDTRISQAQNEAEGKNNFKLLSEKIKPLLELLGEEVCNVRQLQILVETVMSHKNFNDAHYAAMLGSPALLDKPEIKSLVNEADADSGCTPLHAAIKVAKLDNVKELLKIGAKYDAVDNNGRTIFHYAASCKDKKIFEVLNSSHASGLADKLNSSGETALHEACLANLPDNVGALLKLNFNPFLTGQDSDRYPIHCALESNSLRSIELLCTSSADQSRLKDKKNNSPLHLAPSTQAIDILCDFEANLEDKDFKEEDTPLLKKIRENAFELAARLLIRGANVKASDKNGNSALTLAVTGDRPEFVMLLIVFGADVNELVGNDSIRHKVANTSLKNKDAIMYYLHQAGAGRCARMKKDCSSMCSHKGSNNGKPPQSHLPLLKNASVEETLKAHLSNAELMVLDSARERKMSVMVDGQPTSPTSPTSPALPSSRKSSESVSNDKDTASVGSNGEVQTPPPLLNDLPHGDISLAGHRVLIIDGGGLEGLFVIRALQALENLTQQSLKNCFDWIAGTGAGAYIALSLMQDKSLNEILVQYWELLNKVLVGRRPFNASHFEKLLMKQFGEKTKLFEVQGPKTVIFSSMLDKGILNLHKFKNYELPATENSKNKKACPSVNKPNEQLVWQAARSSGLGFGFFDAFGSFVDGCVLAYNPTLDVLEEITEFNFASVKGDKFKPIHVVASVGVKQQSQQIKHQQHELEDQEIINNVDSDASTKKLLTGEVLDFLFNQRLWSFLTHYSQKQQLSMRTVEKSRAWCNDIKVPFFRIQPPYPEPFTHTSTMSQPSCSDVSNGANCCSKVDIRTIVAALWETDMFLKGKSNNLEQLTGLIM